jgi:hypothetical protein
MVTRNAPVPSVDPLAVKLMAGRITRTAALAAVVFAKTVKGPPGPTFVGASATGTGREGTPREYEVRFVHVSVYVAGPDAS